MDSAARVAAWLEVEFCKGGSGACRVRSESVKRDFQSTSQA